MGKNNKSIELKKERLGEENYNSYGTLMKIVEYNTRNDTIIEFQDEYKERVHGAYKEFKKGMIRNPYDKSVYNIGYLGKGKYGCESHREIYYFWKHMLERCYDPYYINKFPTYIDCYVCEEWHNYQNFAKWYEENYYECDNERMALDKDIFIKGNKVYSPKTCCFVPQTINNLFLKRQNDRGKYPIGVCFHKASGKYCSKCSIANKERKNKRVHLGLYDTVDEAFYCYKQFKESYIKQVADEYKDLIPKELYDAMYNYEVEIND